MNKIYLFFILLLIAGITNSQTDSLKTDSCKCKNEISLNVVPIFSEIMVGDVEYQKFNMIYKRRINKGALRLQGFYIPEYSYYYLYDQFHYSRYEDSSDTLRTVYLREISSFCYGGGIGYELQNNKGRIERFLGFDVNFGINIIKYHTKISEWESDNSTSSSNNDEYFEQKIIIDSELETQVMRVGLNPFYGWKIMIEDQFSLAIQFGPDFGYYFGDIATINTNYELSKRETSNFYFSKYFLNEVSVVFKF